MTMKLQHGDFEMTVNSGEMERQIQRALRVAAGPLIDDMQTRVNDMYRQARQHWPVSQRRKSGPHSRDLLQHEMRIDLATGRVVGRLVSPADYTRYIQSGRAAESTRRDPPAGAKLASKAGYTGAVVWLLMRWPERWHADEMVRTLGPELERAMSGVFDG